ncbi:MAG: T9SS type A sorting domain-containing protein [Bacteroidales bacterium]|nr:T9SS type A sorting domain-containing protein [Bacteroidales bacterium]
MIKYILSFALLFIVSNLNSQQVTTDPEFPSTSGSIMVIFNSHAGDAPLANYSGDIYAHTGVMTDESVNTHDWKYVKTNWGFNSPETKLTKINDSIYELSISPDIFTYYGITGDVKVVQLAFVFRSADGSQKTDPDLFIDVYEPGMNVKFSSPGKYAIFKENDNLIINVETISIGTSDADSIVVYIDQVKTSINYNNTLLDTITVIGSGKHKIKAVAYNNDFIVTDSVYYFIRDEISIAELPAGLPEGVNFSNDSTVTLVLLAPGKEYAFVIGDFNQWELSNDYIMYKTPDGERFWLSLNPLNNHQVYRYQYFIEENIRIADPFTERTVDPYDEDIPDYIYPDLTEYPTDKTHEIASVFVTGEQSYEWEIEDFEVPDKENLVIYELLIRDFSANRDIKTVLDSLDYLENLGINAIELMPFNEFEGNQSWGYNPSFYFATDKAYGTKNDYKKFIDECHKRGIAIIMDIVLNHSYGQSPLLRMYFDQDAGKPASDNPWYNESCPHQPWCWGYDFNHESQYTQDFIDRVNRFWLEEYKIDGFRFDFTKGFTNKTGDGWTYDASRIALLKRMADEIREVNEDALLILEHLTDNSEEKELASYGFLLWGNLNYNYNEAVMGWHESNKSNFSGISYKNRSWDEPNLVGYMESHDEERLMYKAQTWGNEEGSYDVKNLNTALHRAEMAATFFFPVPGPKMVWMFGELGYDYSINTCDDGITIDDGCRLSLKPVKWDYFSEYYRKRLYQVYSALINLIQTEPAFKSTDFTLNVSKALKSIHINHNDMDVTIIGNFDVKTGKINPQFQKTGTWYDFFSGEQIEVDDVNDTIILKPGEYHLYTSKKLEKPDILASNNYLPNSLNKQNTFVVWPNPVTENLNIFLELTENSSVEINIYSLAGTIVEQVFTGELEKGLHTINWQKNDYLKGLYLIKSVFNDYQKVRKIIFL